MKKLVYALAVTGLLTGTGVAMAGSSPLTGNFGLATDYIFRGVSQSQHKPEVSGGLDYAFSNGLYVGTWLSNQNWVQSSGIEENSSLEWDTYGGYTGSLPADFGYDVGLIHYQYPGDRAPGAATPNTTEAYVGVSWKFLSLKYNYTVSKYFVGWTGSNGEKTRGSGYLALSANYDLGNGWGVMGHIGHQKVKNFDDASYTDWQVGVSKDVGYGTVSLAYSDTNARDSAYTWGGPNDAKKVANGRLVLSYSKSF